jgi:hypothetical protein
MPAPAIVLAKCPQKKQIVIARHAAASRQESAKNNAQSGHCFAREQPFRFAKKPRKSKKILAFARFYVYLLGVCVLVQA